MKRLGLIAALLVSGPSAFAGDGKSSVSYDINVNLLQHMSSTVETKTDGKTDEQKQTSMATSPRDLYIGIYLDKLYIYLYPQTQGYFGVGYGVMPNLEVGLGLGINSTTLDKPKNEESSTMVNVYTTYTQPIGKPKMEFTLLLGSTTSTTETAAAEGEPNVKTETKGTDVTLGAVYVHPICDGVNYTFGLWYSQTSSEETEAKIDTSSSSLTVNLAGLRLDF